MTTPEIKTLLERLFELIYTSEEKSQDSVLTKFDTGGRPTKHGYGVPQGSGGLSNLELPNNLIFNILYYDVVKTMPTMYQNLITGKFTTNIRISDIAEEEKISESAVANRFNKIYKEINQKLGDAAIRTIIERTLTD